MRLKANLGRKKLLSQKITLLSKIVILVRRCILIKTICGAATNDKLGIFTVYYDMFTYYKESTVNSLI